MRKIIFRGKRVDTEEWTTGSFIVTNCGHTGIATFTKYNGAIECIIDEVIPETLGQFTGLYDRDGKKIYEGDIVEWYYTPEMKSSPFVVEFQHGAFGYVYCGEFHSFEGNKNFDFRLFDTDKRFTLIGNIYDNPELLNYDIGK